MSADHLYIHVPFCRLVCAYCDFVTVAGRGAQIPAYVNALGEELAMRPARGELETIYFGGGTPSLLPAGDVRRLVQAAMDRWGSTHPPIEVTLEANPSSRERPDWRALRAAGVNRVSLGVQSLANADLVTIARGHTAREAREAYGAARRAGIPNLNIDLIYGIPGQSTASWRTVLADGLALQPEHISLYALQLALAPDEWAAPPRAGALRWRRRMATRQDDALAADQYTLAEELLDAAGYRHYELSSWARPGYESIHNGAYWDRGAYTGIGVGAHSYDGSDRRTWNLRDLDAYLAEIAAGRLPQADLEVLDEPTRAFEAIALGLRRVGGLSRLAFAAEFGSYVETSFAPAIASGVDAGWLELTPDALRLTDAGRLFASEALLPFLPNREAVGAA